MTGHRSSAFGDDGGAGPEVRLCPLSSRHKDDMCSTFAYQWTSGEVSGKVARRGAGVGGAAVNLEAITNDHSPDENTKTSNKAATKGNYSFSSVQDGDYWVKTPATADQQGRQRETRVLSRRDHGRRCRRRHHRDGSDHSENLDCHGAQTRNQGLRGERWPAEDLDEIVRGDEAIAGIELELLTITKVSANKKDTTFKTHQTVETDDDGSYSFEDVIEGSSYYVRSVSTGDYYAAEASAKDGFSQKIKADEYPAVEEGEFDAAVLGLQRRYDSEHIRHGAKRCQDVSADFVNFALLYVDGTISGRVREASGSSGNINVELIRCDTYDAGDDDDPMTENVARTTATISRP